MRVRDLIWGMAVAPDEEVPLGVEAALRLTGVQGHRALENAAIVILSSGTYFGGHTAFRGILREVSSKYVSGDPMPETLHLEICVRDKK